MQASIAALNDLALIVVAHRLSTLRTMDRVVVMDTGAVVEQGRFDELAGAGGRFSQLMSGAALTSAIGLFHGWPFVDAHGEVRRPFRTAGRGRPC